MLGDAGVSAAEVAAALSRGAGGCGPQAQGPPAGVPPSRGPQGGEPLGPLAGPQSLPYPLPSRARQVRFWQKFFAHTSCRSF